MTHLQKPLCTSQAGTWRSLLPALAAAGPFIGFNRKGMIMTREALWARGAELRRRDGELPEGPGRHQAAQEMRTPPRAATSTS